MELGYSDLERKLGHPGLQLEQLELGNPNNPKLLEIV